MSQENGGRGRVISLDAFRKKSVIDECGSPKDERPELQSNRGANEGSEEHAKDKGCNCVFCDLEKQGIQITEAGKKMEHLKSLNIAGSINSHDLQKWINNLRTETIRDLVSRVLGLDEKKMQTHPTYSRAVFKIFLEKIKTKAEEFAQTKKEE